MTAQTVTAPDLAGTPDCPKAGDGGSHSISWHQGGTCAFCGASAEAAGQAADCWLDALKFHAHGITPEGLRKLAARVTGEECSLVLGIAGAMEQLAEQGMTPEQAYNLAGMDRVLGPYMSPDRAVHIAAEYMTAGWSSARLPDATRPEVADAIGFLESLGVTAVQAARIAEAGNNAGDPVPSLSEAAAA